jgi:DNA-binding IclR family transcriptional regulator
MAQPSLSAAPPAGAAALDRMLDFWMRLAGGDGPTMRAVAEEMGIPRSTAYRWAAALERRGLVARAGPGRYVAGLALAGIGAAARPRDVLAAVARPMLRRIGDRPGRVAHLGILEDEMVTYLVKEGRGSADVLTVEGLQFEAYCSALGKVLLAGLDPVQLDSYLAGGPFVRMTANTLVDPEAIRAELETVRWQGYAVDRGEVIDGLFCVAVPVRDADGRMVGALSVAGARPLPAREIAAELSGSSLALSRRLIPGLPASRPKAARRDDRQRGDRVDAGGVGAEAVEARRHEGP